MNLQILWGILGILNIVYGVLVLRVASGTRFFAVWFLIGAVFLLLSLPAGNRFLRSIPPAAKTICTGLLIAAFVLFIVVEGLVISQFRSAGDPGADYLIVLGAQVKPEGPSVVLRGRLDAACRYLQDNPETICIVSGSKGWNEPQTEASAMKEYLLEKGIPSERILEEDRAKNTNQNMEYSRNFFNPEQDRVGIVTSNFHMYRSLKLARKAGIRNVTGIASRSVPLYLPNNMLREFFGILKDRLCGNM